MRFERILVLSAAGLLVLGLSCGDDNGNGPFVPVEPPPRQPADLQVTETSETAITLTWRDLSDEEIGFRIERSAGGTSSFAERDTVGRDVTIFVDAAIDTGQTYHYRVQSYGRYSASDFTAPVWAIAAANTTPTVPAEPTPADRTENIESEVITLSWVVSDPDPGDVLSYDVYFGSALGALELIGDDIETTSIDTPEAVDLNYAYFWQVIARDSKGAMGISPVWQFYTRVERIEISAGWLVMGDEELFPHPGNPVWVDGFEMDRFEVTNQQYAAFLNDILHRKPPLIRISGGEVYGPGGQTLYAQTYEMDDDSQIQYERADSLFVVTAGKENFPVIEVTWQGAKAYAEFYGRRLPTEAEWEMAARGNGTESGTRTFTITEADTTYTVTVGLGRTYPWGEDLDGARANFLGSGDPFEGQGRVATTPVGFFDGEIRGGFQTMDGTSPFGIHDMAGNLAEWCEDWYAVYRSPHRPPSTGTLRIIRGASWNKGAGSIEVWRRDFARPYSLGDASGADRTIGFRTVASMP
jgi:formylglycine-generating enzyme required for sulfatase activity